MRRSEPPPLFPAPSVPSKRPDDPVSKLLPGVKLLDKGGVDHAGTITVRHLVQHRSGLPQVPKDLEKKVNNRWSSPDLLRVLTDSWELTLEGTPGQYKY